MEANHLRIAISVTDMVEALWFHRDVLGSEVDRDKGNCTADAFAKVVGLEKAATCVVMRKG